MFYEWLIYLLYKTNITPKKQSFDTKFSIKKDIRDIQFDNEWWVLVLQHLRTAGGLVMVLLMLVSQDHK